MTRPGILPSQAIRAMLASGAVRPGRPLAEGQVQPASLDLRLAARGWRVRASFLAGAGRSVAERLDDFAMCPIDLSAGAVLETGCVYLVPIEERLALPPGVSAAANAKSSTGRLDLFVRIVADCGTEFDTIPEGYEGPLYAEITPRAFSVLVRPGARLTQIRFRRGRAALDDAELRALHAADPLVDREAHIDGGLAFSVGLTAGEPGGVVGWRARRSAPLIDLDRIGHYDPEDFFTPVRPLRTGGVILDPGAFYILVSREAVSVPPGCAAEMTPYLAVAGEFRVHYAGFFDPGFGHASAGGAGARGVLEVRCHEAPFALEDGQVVGRLVYERMAETPDILYGAGLRSNYQGQGLKLAKQFR